MSQAPTIGRIVVYTLTDADAQRINATAQSHNTAREGDEYPAVIVRIWGTGPDAAVNLQVLYDGNGTYWATSRQPGDRPGTWRWPTRA